MLSLVAMFAVAATLQGNMIVSTSWLADNADSNVVVLDIATAQQFGGGHIPGARLIERDQLVVNRGKLLNELPPVDKLESLFTNAGVANAGRIVVYSRDPLLAARAFFTLDYLGYGDRVSLLDGGYAKWLAEGRTVTTHASVYAAVPFRATVKHEALIDKKHVKQNLDSGTAVFIDARPPRQYTGELSSPHVRVPGHIPTAKCIPWQLNLNGDLFKPQGDLRDLYANLGIDQAQQIIVYCRTGMEASMTYFVLRYLGYQPALYDASFSEWSSGPEPVAQTVR